MKKETIYSLQDLLLNDQSNYSTEEKLIILNAMRDDIIKKRRIAYLRAQQCKTCKELLTCSRVFSETLCS